MSAAKTMFCFQCEQTAGCSGCTSVSGVCGKKESTAQLQDELTGALMGLAQTVCKADIVGDARIGADNLVMEGLFATMTNVDFDDAELMALLKRTHACSELLAKGAGITRVCDYDLAKLWNETVDIRSLKSLILLGLRGMGAYAYHAAALSYHDEVVSAFLYEGLSALVTAESDELLPLALKVGEINLLCMELLDRANTETFGNPVPAEVSRTIKPGPFIVVTGHDLHDLALLLQQTQGRGISVYTHGELLPAHGYPELQRYEHLAGHMGTAWQNQREEFAKLPGAILFTSNCLMPPASSYADRVFTTAAVAFPDSVHIKADAQGNKDFTPVIKRALELGGFKEEYMVVARDGINDPQVVKALSRAPHFTTGFGHATVLAQADTVVDAVKQGVIGHFFLVGGCDGAHPERNYFRNFVKQAPNDSLILTLACGKFRFNDLDLGTIAGLPRLMDMGQCNDAYGAIKVAVALADAFGCGVNDLPLTLVLSWYEQKAVCILLSLLFLGIKGIYLGPTLPAFISPAILEVLVEKFDLHLISTPEADLARILGKEGA